MMSFALDDVVWCPNPHFNYWPGKVSLDAKTKTHLKDTMVFVQKFSSGQGRPPKGQWFNLSEVVCFEGGSSELVFENPGLQKAFNSAQKSSKGKVVINIDKSKAEVQQTRKRRFRLSKTQTKQESGDDTKVKATPKRGRRSNAQVKEEENRSSNEADAKTKSTRCRRSRANKENASKEGDDGPEIDEDVQISMTQDNKQFLDDLDSDSGQDDDKENDNDWRPRDDKENAKPGSLFVLKGVAKKRKPFTPLARLMALPKDEPSEYELIQERRKEEQRKMLESMRLASAALTKSLTPGVAKAKRSSVDPKGPLRRRQSAPVLRYSTRQQPPRTRSRLTSTGSSSDSTPRKRAAEDGDEDVKPAPKRKRVVRSHPTRWIKNPNTNFLMPADVTPTMLANVSDIVSEKIYDKVRGSSCHQCRQKTLDMKTICRSSKCHGVRGQFCGVCLLNRYGEDARKALMDPEWSCPPCRDICNCSICRNRDGKGATGIITPLAIHKGFKSVKEYLDSLTEKYGHDNFDDSDDE